MAEEVEIKFLIRDLPALEVRLRELGFRLHTPRALEVNTLYDTPDQALRRRGELLRLRRYGERWTLTHKSGGSSARYKRRVELQTELGDGSQMDAILNALGFAPGFRYEKFRTAWADDTGEVVLDETPIGNVAEIEGPPEWIEQTARNLGVAPEEFITKNYAQLFAEWKQRTGSKAHEMTFEAVGG